MWTQRASRKQFFQHLNAVGKAQPHGDEPVDATTPGLFTSEVIELAWPKKPPRSNVPPSAVILDDSKRRDFLAWVLTYLPSFSPFTAYFRVVDRETAERCSAFGEPHLDEFADAAVGLILCEAAAYLEHTNSPSQLSSVSSASTCSFALGRSFALGVFSAHGRSVASAWQTARETTQQRHLPLEIGDILEPWQVLRLLQEPKDSRGDALGRLPPEILKAGGEIRRNGAVGKKTWKQLVGSLPFLPEAPERMTGRREDRVQVLEKALRILATELRSQLPLGAFLAGYLASRVSDGSLEHVELVRTAADAFPAALLWYGLCAGLHPHSVVRRTGMGLGNRILRDLSHNDNFFDLPRCDIAVAELEILGDSEFDLSDLRTRSPSLLEVELSPCVSTIVRWPPGGRPPGSQQDLFPEERRREELRHFASELGSWLDRGSSLRARLDQVLGRGTNNHRNESRRTR